MHARRYMYGADRHSARRGDDRFLHGPPELIVEIAATSASYDLRSRFNACRCNGMYEYVAWRTCDGAMEWFEPRQRRWRTSCSRRSRAGLRFFPAAFRESRHCPKGFMPGLMGLPQY